MGSQKKIKTCVLNFPHFIQNNQKNVCWNQTLNRFIKSFIYDTTDVASNPEIPLFPHLSHFAIKGEKEAQLAAVKRFSCYGGAFSVTCHSCIGWKSKFSYLALMLIFWLQHFEMLGKNIEIRNSYPFLTPIYSMFVLGL